VKILAEAMCLFCLVIAWPAAAQQPEIATVVAFTEGPTVDREGNVYFTDIINERIMKLSTDGVLSIYREKSNVANGLLIDPQGRLIACEGAEFARPGVTLKGKPRVTRTELKTGKIEVLADNYEACLCEGRTTLPSTAKAGSTLRTRPAPPFTGSTPPAGWRASSPRRMSSAPMAFKSPQTIRSCILSKPIRRKAARA
jgi:hypothetical protein